MTLKTERRTQHRKRPLSLVYVELPPANGGMMRDLSEQGFSLRAMLPVSPSEKIPFSFVLEASARIEGDAIVLRVEDGGRVAALEFAGLPAHCRDQIRRWLEKFDEPISPDSDQAQPEASKNSSLTELRAQIRAPKAPPQTAGVASIPVPAPEPGPSPPPPEPPPVAEIPVPSAPIVMALPMLASPPVPEPRALSRSQSNAQVEAQEQEGPTLPPLLKLSSVRPGPPPAELPPEPDVAVEAPKSIAGPPARTSLFLRKPVPFEAVEISAAEPIPVPPVVRKQPPPALEPISSFEGETDSAIPRWMDRFTLGRAVGIMLFLALLASSYVYHRELGQALIWLGQQIAGDDSAESSKFILPTVPPAMQQAPEQSPGARAVEPAPPAIERSNASTEITSDNLPAASDKTPSPQLKEASPGSLVPLTQVTRPPAPTASGDNSVEPGQAEYLQALQILRSPGRSSEVPAAIQHLWAAVEKGNTEAEIDLAELFRTGRGVVKNCDQARILLSAAARKGSGEARKRLEELRRLGCRN